MKNFDYDKVIIMKYLTGGGGIFLQSCLGLNDDAVFMREDLVRMQLNNKLSIEKKLKYLLLATKQQSEKKIWDDWGFKYYFPPPEENYTLLKKYKLGSILTSRGARIHINIMKLEEIRNCIDNNKFLFFAFHEDHMFISALHRWKNSKVIIFKNEQKFSSKRTLGRFGTHPRPFSRSLETKLQNYQIYASKGKFGTPFSSCSITKLQLDQSQINNKLYEWDCDWYFSKDKTISEIEKLYDSFGLSGFNAEMISEFYEAWTNAIKLYK